jgi:hypothetical protein
MEARASWTQKESPWGMAAIGMWPMTGTAKYLDSEIAL